MPSTEIVKTIISSGAKVAGLSVTMVYNLNQINKAIKIIRESKECSDLKIIVGGYAFKNNENLWKDIGADYFAVGVEEAVSIITNLA